MTYKTRCNGNCIERLETQAETIKRERKSRMELFNENSDLKERIRKLERRQPVVLREDANWDSIPREESWEL